MIIPNYTDRLQIKRFTDALDYHSYNEILGYCTGLSCSVYKIMLKKKQKGVSSSIKAKLVQPWTLKVTERIHFFKFLAEQRWVTKHELSSMHLTRTHTSHIPCFVIEAVLELDGAQPLQRPLIFLVRTIGCLGFHVQLCMCLFVTIHPVL